ncbi:acyltransferase family protein [Pararobbsia alpina]|uniref:acyltransferase family protein n=1 Tax=Pararobbsia alpina TaxID=621374 RepID=UPI0015829525|nr:acyltransferase family protein [Pararobbsia alpina]
MEFRKDINGLRAIAVLAVVFYHFGVPYFKGGFVGVDVFFVVSGYLLTTIVRGELEAGRYSTINFLSNRLRRIFPALCVLLCACVFWATYSYLPGDYKRIVRDATSALLIRSNYAFVDNSGYFSPDARQNILLHTWSLSVESQFYLIFSVLCGVFWPKGRGLSRLLGGGLFFVLAAMSLIWCIWHTPANQPAAFYLLWSRAWEFMAGSIAALCGARELRVSRANILATLGAILLLGGIAGFDSTMPYPGWRALLPVVGTMLIVVTKRSYIARLLGLQPLQFVGSISYSVYLWHWPLMVAFRERTGVVPTPVDIIILLIASIVAGWASYSLVEQPLRRRARSGHLAFGLAGTIAAGLVFSGVLTWTEGWPQRLPVYVQPAIAARDEPNPRAAECMRDANGVQHSAGEFCVLGTLDGNRPPVAMLWGDSFAGGLQPTVSSILKDIGISGILASEGGCPPFIGTAFKGSGADYFPGCEKYANFVFKYFEQTPSISLVVVAGDWKRYDADYEGSVLKKIAQVLAARNGRMVVLGAVPDPLGDVPHMWARKEFQAAKAVPNMTVSRESQAKLLDEVARIVTPSLTVGDVMTVEPFSSLCSAKECFSVRDDRALFLDTDHLSKAGIRYIEPQLRAAITLSEREIEEARVKPHGSNPTAVALPRLRDSQPGHDVSSGRAQRAEGHAANTIEGMPGNHRCLSSNSVRSESSEPCGLL